MTSAIIVEDSRLARLGLKKMLCEHVSIQLLSEAESAEQALGMIENYKPELLFLDIDMPGKNGFELLSDLSYQPQVIFTTAFSEFAMRSFDYHTVDYLLKPIMPDRLEQAISKINDKRYLGAQPLARESRIFIKDKGVSHMPLLASIRKFESCGNYTRVYFDDASPFIYKSLSKIEARLPDGMFFRPNRQVLVNLNFIDSLAEPDDDKPKMVMNDGEVLPISRGQFSKLKALFSL